MHRVVTGREGMVFEQLRTAGAPQESTLWSNVTVTHDGVMDLRVLIVKVRILAWSSVCHSWNKIIITCYNK
jgi:hypothetical protein